MMKPIFTITILKLFFSVVVVRSLPRNHFEHGSENSLLTPSSVLDNVDVNDCPYVCNCTSYTVDCSNKGLTTIPTLPATVREVFLNSNKISNVTCTAFAYLTNLRHLDLSNNLLSSIPNCAFKDLGHLEHLNLFKNKLPSLENNAFEPLFSLRFLSLQSNLLSYRENTFAPRCFNGLRSLETLYLHGNEPNASPNIIYPDIALSAIPTLQNLRLDGYSNRQLGPGFAALTNLTSLNFSPRQHRDEDAFCNMHGPLPGDFFAHLKTTHSLYLSLSNCNLSNLSEEVFTHLPTLYNLDLSFNEDIGFKQFETLSKGLVNTTITVLNINHIDRMSRDHFYFPMIHNTTFLHIKKTNLTILSLEDNEILYIDPKAFHYLPHTIEHITVHNNNLFEIFFAIPLIAFTNLKKFNGSRQLHRTYKHYTHTDLKSESNVAGLTEKTLTESFKISAQRKVDYEDFEKKASDLDFCGGRTVLRFPLPINLEVLDLSDINNYGDLPEIQFSNNRLKRLDYSSNNAHCISGPFIGLPILMHLDLSKNFCSRLNPNFFEKLTTLKTLFLYDNILGETLEKDANGTIFSYLTSLEHIYLGNNIIRDLSLNAFINNPNLRTVDLSNNALWQFSPSLEKATHLQTLDLSSNSLRGLPLETCRQLQEIKSNNKDLKVYIGRNHFTCTCDNFQFLVHLAEYPEIFGDLKLFECHSENGNRLSYHDLEHFLPILRTKCASQSLFTAILAVFLVLIAGVSIFALYHYKRWQWTFLYYVGKSRLHIGSTLLTYEQVAEIFFTFDQDNLACRRLVHTAFLPWLKEAGISHILGEVDFGAGPLISSIAGAVVSTTKTVVLLSAGMFEDYYRALEVNLAVMQELHMRTPVLVPVILLRRRHGFGADAVTQLRPLDPFHSQIYDDGDDDDDDGYINNSFEDLLVGNHLFSAGNEILRQDSEYVAHEETLQDLLDDFPPEISAYLMGQMHRCIFYDGGSRQFWNQLASALLTDV